MKRVLKWIVCVLAVLAAIPVLVSLGIIGHYYSIVLWTPGNLKTGATPGELGSKVNVFAATGGYPFLCAHDTPAATTPFGMVRLAPDTGAPWFGWNGLNRSGYFYGDNKLLGFSHTRLVGADAQEGGVFRILPAVESRTQRLYVKDRRHAKFSHREETGFPGYYAVRLPKDDVLVELTATPRVGVHRYTFRKPETPHLLVDITSGIGKQRCEDGVVLIKPSEQAIEGSVRIFGSFSGRYGGLDVYFAAHFSEPFAKYGTWKEGRPAPGTDGAAGKDIGADLGFNAKTVEVRLALSYVSIENARQNLEAEAAGKTFDQLVDAAKDAWEKRLATIRIEGGSKTQQRIFYTNLYHAFLMPTTFSDVNGDYLGFDNAVHKAEGFTYYTDFSKPNTWRTAHPLYNLIARSDARDMMISLVDMAKKGGALPRWPSGRGYTNCMLGTPADIAVTEAWIKGIRDFDAEAAYRSMRQVALAGPPEGSRFAGRHGLEWYLRLGYCPSDKTGDCVAATLEYAYEDYGISLLAEALGYKEDAELFAKRSRNYRNTWNPATLYFEGKDSDGNFPKERNHHILSYVDFKGRYTRAYCEGSGEQWRWFVPFDPEGLMSLFPSRERFVEELETYFERSRAGIGELPSSYYWHGNEPYIHTPYLFNAAGRPDLTRKWVRWIIETKHSDDYIGLDGNDDGGTLSSWHTFSALGFYPRAGTTRYELGAPLFKKAEVQIGGKTLTIIADNYDPKNIHVKKVTLNGKPLDRLYFTHDEIAGGGTIRFEMIATPEEG